MIVKKYILWCLLTVLNCFIMLLPVKDRIVFIHLKGKKLESDLLILYNELKKKNKCIVITTTFTKNSLKTNILYMLNTFKQLYYINTSSLTILNNNNYVVSTFKRSNVKVLQIWHATGAIKKFGNCLDRVYKIERYDAVICCSDYFVEVYKEAFGCNEVYVTGMPRLDAMNKTYSSNDIFVKYPQLRNKKVVLYAPTFRGNVYGGMYNIPIDLDYIQNQLGEEYIIVGKYHPLVEEDASVLCINDIPLYDLFHLSHCLVSDYSSIIFDYSLYHKSMSFYVPDLDIYKEDIGLFIDYEKMPGDICRTEEELVKSILQGNKENIQSFSNKFIKHHDKNNTQRVLELIEYIKKQ